MRTVQTTRTEAIAAARAPLPALVYSITEVCALAHMSRSSFYIVVNAGELKPVKRGHRTLIPAAELARFLSALPKMAANENAVSLVPYVAARKRGRVS